MEENVRRGDNRKWNATTTAKSCLKKRPRKTASKTLALHKWARKRGNKKKKETPLWRNREVRGRRPKAPTFLIVNEL